MRRTLAALAAAGALAPSAAAAPPLRILELPGVDALPRTPPLAPPQPPITEAPSIRGTVFARERVTVGIAVDGKPRSVRVVQRLDVRSLGDYLFFVPAPATTVSAGPVSESQPGLRPNQIIWQGFSPRRKTLEAVADLRPEDSVAALPLRVRVDGVPAGAGPFELTVTVENATRTRASVPTGEALEADVAAAVRALRAAARIRRPLEGRGIRIRGTPRPGAVEAWVAFAVRGAVTFPAGAVDGLTRPRFRRLLGRDAVRIAVRGTATRAAAPKLRLTAEPLVADALPPRSARTLDAAVLGSLRYARTLQFQRFLANPDPQGPSTATYVYETAADQPVVRTQPASGHGSAVATVLVVGGLLVFAAGAVVLWAHS